MFKISPIQDLNTQRRYAVLCGTKYIEGYFAYSMTDAKSGELMGFSQFEIGEGSAFLSDLKPLIDTKDFEAMFILGRATMNFIDLCGVHIIKADSDTADNTLLRAIGFKEKDDGYFYADTTGMFEGKCDGHAVNLDK